jgi:transcriptional regulator with XRE-family HTH domain
MAHDKKRRNRAKLTDEIIRVIWKRIRLGEYQHDIAADLGINQGRISEIKTGKRGSHITGLRAA